MRKVLEVLSVPTRKRFAGLLLTILLISTRLLLSNPSSWRISFEPIPAAWSKADTAKILTIKLKNVGQNTAWVFESNPLNDYAVSVTDAKGVALAMTSQGMTYQRNQRNTLFANGRARIPPGSSYAVQVNLNDFYDLSVGKYIFRAELRSKNGDAADLEKDSKEPQGDATMPVGSVPILVKP